MPQPSTAATLVDLLRRQADRYRDKTAFSFSYNGDDEHVSALSFAELDRRARQLAVALQAQGAAGQRVLVFCRPGLDGIVGYFGCLYAGAIAVPLHQKLAPRLSSVVPDAQARFALAATSTQANIRAGVDTLIGLIDGPALTWLPTDGLDTDPDAWVPPALTGDSTAMVQYTSGSTRSPNGVVLAHANLLHNVEVMRRSWRGDDDAVSVYWLPQHHDMGLIGGILEMLYVGATTHLMSPSAFVQRPLRWLEAMSRHRATITAAPNFAYDQCIERSTAEERAALDLSAWSVALTGSEPIRAATLRTFAEAFAPAGFQASAFRPAYGLAEATLLISGGPVPAPYQLQRLDRTALGEDRVVEAGAGEPAAEIVGCGRLLDDQDVVIVDPETRLPCEPDRVGEIWVAGPSVAQGYLDKPEETAHTFGAMLADSSRGPFLRTGDLGFLRDGELYMTGRVKDLIVLGGTKHYPNDIEATVQAAHPDLLTGRGAAFAVAGEGEESEQLVIAQEVALGQVGEAQLTEIVAAIQAALRQQHYVRADSVVLVTPFQLPTTSSGKIQRGASRQQFGDRSLSVLAEWHAPLAPVPAGGVEQARLAGILRDAAARRERAAR